MEKQIYADVLVLTVTDVETRAVFDSFKSPGCEKPRVIDGGVYFNLGTINGARVRLMQSAMGSGTLGGSQQSVAKGIAAMRPRYVMMVGIAFGLNDQKQAIGDILVGTQVRPYELQRVGTGPGATPEILMRDAKPHTSAQLVSLLKGAAYTWDDAKVRFGLLLTGDKLIDNLGFRSTLAAQEPEAIGGDMEAAGVYVACQDAKVDWIVAKAICDFADGEKHMEQEKRQATAARNAAGFLRHVLEFADFDWAPATYDVPTSASHDPVEGSSELESLLQKSFDYCLSRRKRPDAASNTCMYFFGLNFDLRNPRPRRSLIVQAIGTEIDHLTKVIMGEIHNPGKAAGVEQIADEIVDLWRYLFMLAIVVGVERWEEFPWMRWFLHSYQWNSNHKLPYFTSKLSDSYRQLVQLNGSHEVPKEKITDWLSTQVETIGGLTRLSGVTLRDLSKDLMARLIEDKASPEATTQHRRHERPSAGVFFTLHAYILDKPGTYRMLLRELSDLGYDIWASVSNTLVWSETAQVLILLAKGHAECSADDELKRLLHHVRGIELKDPAGRSLNAKHLIVSCRGVSCASFSASTEGDFVLVVSKALQEFWQSVSSEIHAKSMNPQN